MKKPGYSLIELMLAVSLFALAILTTLGAFNLALKVTKAAREITVATNLAEQIIEQLREKSFSSINLDQNPTAQATTKLPGGFTKTTIDYYEGNDKIKQVTVEVYWESRPEAEAITLITLISQGGINQ